MKKWILGWKECRQYLTCQVSVKNKYKEVIYGLIIMSIKVTNPE
jgi:hypothetical protein